MRAVFSSPLSALLPVLGSFAPSLAEATNSNTDLIIVTAARAEERLVDSLAPVTVLTRPDIERIQALDVQELLAGLPGVQIANSGGRGKATSLFLRGTNSDHVLVLIDGIKVGSATAGTTAFEQIPIDQIERIEIVRGPRSSLYGSEAIGGIIQLFTRRGRGSTRSFSVGSGTEGSSQLQAGLSGGSERAWYNVSLSALNTEGIDSRPSFNQPDRDGYWNAAGSARAGFRLNDRAELAMSWLRAESENEFDGSAQNESRNTQQVTGVVLRLDPFERWRMSFTVGRSIDDAESFMDGSFSGRFVTHRDNASWQNEVLLPSDQMLSFGTDHRSDRVGGTTDYAVDSRHDTGVFAQYRGSLGRHELQLSVRWDENSQFGSHTTGAAAWGYPLTSGTRLTVSHGTAFKAPTFNQLYFPGFGNPALRPEESHSSEIGLSGVAGAWNWRLSAYESRIENLIVNVTTPAGLVPTNIGRARIRALEAEAGATLGDWRVQGYVTLMEPIDRSGGVNDGKWLPRRARQSARLEIDRQLARLSVGVTVKAAGECYDNAANTTRMPGYVTVDLRLQYQLAPHWLLQAQAANLFDERYETVATYAQPGRTLFFTLRYAEPFR